MKKYFLSICILAVTISTSFAQKYEYKVVTSIESIIPGGIGRSRLIENNQSVNVNNLTTERTDGKKSRQNEVDRDDAKVDNLYETKLLNFYSFVGINFQNIASNDAIIQAKLNQLSDEGWELLTISSGVESDAGKDDNQGIFITRYILKREKK